MTDRNSSSKFYCKSLTLLVQILEMVRGGSISADIARSLSLQKSHVSYYVSKAKKIGYLKEVTRDTYEVLELTQGGTPSIWNMFYTIGAS